MLTLSVFLGSDKGNKYFLNISGDIDLYSCILAI